MRIGMGGLGKALPCSKHCPCPVQVPDCPSPLWANPLLLLPAPGDGISSSLFSGQRLEASSHPARCLGGKQSCHMKNRALGTFPASNPRRCSCPHGRVLLPLGTRTGRSGLVPGEQRQFHPEPSDSCHFFIPAGQSRGWGFPQNSLLILTQHCLYILTNKGICLHSLLIAELY